VYKTIGSVDASGEVRVVYQGGEEIAGAERDGAVWRRVRKKKEGRLALFL
jgi:hypothetical protein